MRPHSDYQLVRQTVLAVYRVLLSFHPDTAEQPSLKRLDPLDRFALEQVSLSAEVRAVVDGPVYEAIWTGISLTRHRLENLVPSTGILAETAHNELLGQLAMACQIIMRYRDDDIITVVHGTCTELLGSALRQLNHLLTVYFAPPESVAPEQVLQPGRTRPWHWLLRLVRPKKVSRKDTNR